MVSNSLLGDVMNNFDYIGRSLLSMHNNTVHSESLPSTSSNASSSPSSSSPHSHNDRIYHNLSNGSSAGKQSSLQPENDFFGALKEWAIVCKAIEEGDQVLLFRKGGIMEFRKGFELKFKNFFLFPTFEHQTKESVRPEYQTALDQLERENNASNNNADVSNSSSNNITEISSFVEITYFKEVPSLDSLKELEQFQIWTEDYLKMRFNYNPKKPLYMLLLRAYKLNKPIQMVNKPQWVGCKSWIQIDSHDQDLSAYFEHNLPNNPFDYLRSISKPCIDDDKFNRLSEKVRSVI
ncbi:DUF1802 family protein [Candidatus Nitrosocosmicus agrestis]|uniref:DUF1802 family protein n=1 Tax=Candidatus Nitrosocosmicus agrestis TaxID=2563600 RepID=UPI00122E12C3|nr:DUF1802 family protein [Candidatus Nitrosocosmicus sp. SS]KAA2282960.1 DUF1802 family protein [Candidatus Nitrosocosmicus sp. SS]KAF0869163.1 DUF1802 family protein [Candidatus Nitrosocosmicus sp. SS]